VQSLASQASSEQGWQARLDLRFAASDGPTRLVERSHQGPLVVQRPFYPDADGTCHVYLLHPPGGVVGGDGLHCRVHCERSAKVLITTPAATKLYRTPGGHSELSQQLRVERGARLEWLPQETIAFGQAHCRVSTWIELAAGADYLGWEVLCLGRPASGDHFGQGRLQLSTELYREGVPLRIERADYVGGALLQSAAFGLRGQPVCASLICVAPGAPELVAAVRAALPDGSSSATAVTRVGEVLLVRYLGPRVEAAHAVLRRAFAVLRPALWQLEAREPRIWRT
jgi:urease accessory protein